MYQPGLNLTSPSPNDNVVDVSLALPSSLSHDIQSKCPPRLVAMEKDLRLSQCHDALSSLRLHLHSRSRILKDKYVNVRNQGPNTRSQGLLERISAQISAAAERYNTARSALDALDPDPVAQWRIELLVLHTKDIRGVSEPSLPNHPDPERASAILTRILLSGGAFPEGNNTPSWIWRGAPTSTDAVSGYNEGFVPFFVVDRHLTLLFPAYQLEWSKSYARNQRWQEEVKLLKEEMRRTLEFLKWKSSLWSAKASGSGSPSSFALREGLSAYACRQAAIFTSLRSHFLLLWQGFKVLDSSTDQPALVPVPFEEAMQGVDGGDVDLG